MPFVTLRIAKSLGASRPNHTESTMNISKENLKHIKLSPWDFFNDQIYKLCDSHPEHTITDKILAKVLIIGRTYAAAIERRKNKSEENDAFYIEKVAPLFKKLDLDAAIAKVKVQSTSHKTQILKILKLHQLLTKATFNLTKQNKRSFASKYLHFHLPHHFFIFDSRATKAISSLNIIADKELIKNANIDEEYGVFFLKCWHLQKQINEEHGVSLTPREIDNLLISVEEGKIPAPNNK